jgi:hypothetical protein
MAERINVPFNPSGLQQISNEASFKQKAFKYKVEDPALTQLLHAAKIEVETPTPKPIGLPTDSAARKRIPLWSGLFRYFPDALAEVAKVSFVGNEQHNPGEPLHWARGKSMDQEDTILRHMLDHESGPIDTDGVYHLAKAAWRSLAYCQLEIEKNNQRKGV